METRCLSGLSLPQRRPTMTVEELQKDLLFDIASSFMMANVPKEDYQSVQTKVIALVAAVEEQTKKQILDASITQFPMGNGTYMMIRTSILDPREAGNDK
jgi:hypothetical protein